MKIDIYYDTGLFRRLDTTEMTTPDPFKQDLTKADRGSANITTEYLVRFDRLEDDGVAFDILWHNLMLTGDTQRERDELYSQEVPVACLEMGRRVVGVGAAEVRAGRIVKVELDGKKVAWRDGDWLINGFKFMQYDELYCNEDMPQKAKAGQMFAALRHEFPDRGDEDICNMIGYPVELLGSILEFAAFHDCKKAALSAPPGGWPVAGDGEGGGGGDAGAEDGGSASLIASLIGDLGEG